MASVLSYPSDLGKI